MIEVAVIPEEVYFSYFDELLKGNREKCREIVMGLVEQGAAIRDIYELLFRRSLYQVGELWEKTRSRLQPSTWPPRLPKA